MPFFKRAKKPDAAAKNPVSPAPDGPGYDEDKGDKNAIALARTRTEDIVYPTGLKLVFLMLSTFVSMFLVALVCIILRYWLWRGGGERERVVCVMSWA